MSRARGDIVSRKCVREYHVVVLPLDNLMSSSCCVEVASGWSKSCVTRHAGDTYLMRDLKSEELVAVKLIPRPIPKAIVPAHVFREIKVPLPLREIKVPLPLREIKVPLPLLLEDVWGNWLCEPPTNREPTDGRSPGHPDHVSCATSMAWLIAVFFESCTKFRLSACQQGGFFLPPHPTLTNQKIGS